MAKKRLRKLKIFKGLADVLGDFFEIAFAAACIILAIIAVMAFGGIAAILSFIFSGWGLGILGVIAVICFFAFAGEIID